MVGRESLVARDPLGVIWESLFAGRSVVGRTEVISRAKPVKCWKGVIGRGRSVRGWPKIICRGSPFKGWAGIHGREISVRV